MPTSPHEAHPISTEQSTTAIPSIERKKLGFMSWLERRSQPYIVVAMAIVAVLRGFYLFTDKLFNLAKYPTVNVPLSILTGILLSIGSELTVAIAGRRHKLYTQQLFTTKLAMENATKQAKPMWAIEVERLDQQVRANLFAMRISMGMSLVAAASYLIDSTGADGLIPFLIASALGAYVLYLMYYHGVQTDEIKEDGTQETADQILEVLNVIRVEEVKRLREDLAQATLSIPARLGLIATGLPVPAQRQVMPTLKLLLGKEEPENPEEEQDTTFWWSMKQLAQMAGEDFSTRKLDDITRKYRRRVSDNAHRFPEYIQLDSARGWLIDPSFAERLFTLPKAPEGIEPQRVVDAEIIQED